MLPRLDLAPIFCDIEGDHGKPQAFTRHRRQRVVAIALVAQTADATIPMKRLAQPEDFPALVEYFLSDAAGFVTGQTVSVSGGLTMHG